MECLRWKLLKYGQFFMLQKTVEFREMSSCVRPGSQSSGSNSVILSIMSLLLDCDTYERSNSMRKHWYKRVRQYLSAHLELVWLSIVSVKAMQWMQWMRCFLSCITMLTSNELVFNTCFLNEALSKINVIIPLSTRLYLLCKW